MSTHDEERTPLLQNRHNGGEEHRLVTFGDDDVEDPKQWPLRSKYIQVALICLLALICPLASSIMSPAISDIQSSFNTNRQMVVGSQATFVCMLGIGPLFWAPMSETFGRRPLFLINLALFTLMQIPTALSPNIGSFIACRTLSGLFGSVTVANGGGSVSDLFIASERANVLGVYLLGPLLGPTLGPAVGGLIVAKLHWRWIFWIVLVISGSVTLICYFFLHESNGVVILSKRKAKLAEEHPEVKYEVDGASDQPLIKKILNVCASSAEKSSRADVVQNSSRATRILVTQPIVLTMSAYQALIFSTMYSLYASFEDIWKNYGFNDTQVALTYLGPTAGFLLSAAIIVPLIDKVYKTLASKHGNEKGVPEYRLPLANIGAVILPISLFWLGWTVQYNQPWPIPLASTLLFGASHVSIFNPCQNYYIDSFEAYAASALAAGAFLRSLVGGIVPLFVSKMFDQLGYGWGLSVFGFLSVLLMPAPLAFYFYGAKLREKFAVDL